MTDFDCSFTGLHMQDEHALLASLILCKASTNANTFVQKVANLFKVPAFASAVA